MFDFGRQDGASSGSAMSFTLDRPSSRQSIGSMDGVSSGAAMSFTLDRPSSRQSSGSQRQGFQLEFGFSDPGKDLNLEPTSKAEMSSNPSRLNPESRNFFNEKPAIGDGSLKRRHEELFNSDKLNIAPSPIRPPKNNLEKGPPESSQQLSQPPAKVLQNKEKAPELKFDLDLTRNSKALDSMRSNQSTPRKKESLMSEPFVNSAPKFQLPASKPLEKKKDTHVLQSKAKASDSGAKVLNQAAHDLNLSQSRALEDVGEEISMSQSVLTGDQDQDDSPEMEIFSYEIMQSRCDQLTSAYLKNSAAIEDVRQGIVDTSQVTELLHIECTAAWAESHYFMDAIRSNQIERSLEALEQATQAVLHRTQGVA